VYYLELVENGVANSGHEHHRDQDGDNTAVRHGVPIISRRDWRRGGRMKKRRRGEAEKRRGGWS
jgi:hypothetical protein